MKNVKASVTSALIAAAVSGIMSGSASAAVPADASTGLQVNRASNSIAGVQVAAEATPTSDKHECKGKNSCKGKGGCKTGDEGCKGKNSCKGKGGCNTMDEKKS